MTDRSAPSFKAYASQKQALVVVASLAPMISLMAWVLVINSTFPIAVRIGFGLMIGFFALILVGPSRAFRTQGPMLEVGPEGFRWQAWSAGTIPWDAVERWKVTSTLGNPYVTIWFHEPSRYPATTTARWTQYFNGWVSQGHMAVPAGGLNRRFEEIAAAFKTFAPKAPLPTDPRLARRLENAREQSRTGR